MLETGDGGYDVPVDLEGSAALLCRDPGPPYAAHAWIYNCTFMHTRLEFGSIFSMGLCSKCSKRNFQPHRNPPLNLRC